MSGSKTPLQRPRILDRIEVGLRRIGFNDYTLLLLLAAIVGIVAGGGVVLFRLSYEGLTAWMLPGAHGHDVLEGVRNQAPWILIAVLAVVGLIVALLHRAVVPGGEFHGVAQVIDAVAFREGRIPIWTTLVRFATNALSIAAGGSVGPEGPVIELGSGLASAQGQALKLSPERVRTLVGCGAAAGLAAAFNAPIAGVIFALEVVLKDFAIVTFSPILVSAVIATTLSRAALGDTPAFPVPSYELASAWELPLYVVLGAVAGFWGTMFTHSLRRGERLAAKIPIPRPMITVIGGALLGVGLLFLPELYGVGYEPITHLLNGDTAWQMLLVLLVAKLIATDLTLASGFAGGIFAPILFMGGALGGLVGHAGRVLLPGQTSAPGAYALVGMAALMAAVTHAPITSILLLFEMTGGYEVILPLMLSCIAAVAVAQAMSRDSAFTLGFRDRGLEVNYGRESAILRNYYVEDLMHSTMPKVRVDTPFGEILDGFFENRDDRWFVVDADEKLVGAVDLHDIKSVLQQQGLRWIVIAADVMQPAGVSAMRRQNLEEAIHMLSGSEYDQIPVLEDPESERLVGLLSRADVLDLYNREILHRDILGIKLVHEDTGSTDFVDLPSEYTVELFDVNKSMVGKTLVDIDPRGRYGVNVLAIKHPGRRVSGRNELPDPHLPLQARDRLIVVGRKDELESMRKELTS